MLLNENTLLILDHQTRGEQKKQLLTQVKNFPKEGASTHTQSSALQSNISQNNTSQNSASQSNTPQNVGQSQGQDKGTLLQVKIQSVTPQGRAVFTLPSGQTFEAQLPKGFALPTQATLLLHIKNTPQNTPQSAPQIHILRALLPAKNPQTQPQLQPSSTPSILLDISQQTPPKIGQKLNFNAQLPSIKQNIITPPLFKNAQLSATEHLPKGIITGQITAPPTKGVQPLQFNLNGAPTLHIKNGPLFTPNTQVEVRFLQPTQASLISYTPPKGGALPWALTPQSLKNNTLPHTGTPLDVHVHKQTQTTLTLITKEGQKLTLKPADFATSPLKEGQTLPPVAPPPVTAHKGAHPSHINTQYTPGVTMTIRFTPTGLLQVLDIPPQQNPHQNTHQNVHQNTQNNTQLNTSNITPKVNSSINTTASTQTLTGQVVEQKANGQLILEVGPIPQSKQQNNQQGVQQNLQQTARFPIQSQRFLPVGSQVTFFITADGHGEITQISLPQGSAKHNAILQFSTRWEGLHQALTELERADPTLTRQLIQTFPRADEGLLQHLITFSQGVAEQNLKALFSEDILNILRALGLDGMLKADMAQINTLQTPRGDGTESWRALFFPYWEEQEENLRQGAFFWRRQKTEDTQKTPDSIRFILNVHLSNLGQIQLDGLMYEEKNLKLKLETQNALNTEEQKNLQTLVQKSIIAIGLEGNITIKQVNYFQIDPQREMLINNHEDTKIINNLNIKA